MIDTILGLNCLPLGQVHIHLIWVDFIDIQGRIVSFLVASKPRFKDQIMLFDLYMVFP
jgi:hypothetical protein